jgi:hypothetical protein
MPRAGNGAVANHAVGQRPAVVRATGISHLELAVHIEDGVPAAIMVNGPCQATFNARRPAGAAATQRDKRHAGLAS